MRWRTTVLYVLGAGLVIAGAMALAYGLTGYTSWRGGITWRTDAREGIAMGVGLLVSGAFVLGWARSRAAAAATAPPAPGAR